MIAGSNIIEEFEKQVRQSPHKKAATFNANSLTYKELNTLSSNLANQLIEQYRIKTGDIVGLYSTPSLEILIGMLGILKSGAAYLPLDPMFPESRLEYMLDDSQAKLVIGMGNRPSWICDVNEFLKIDTSLLNDSQNEFSVIPKDDDIAYIIYTSGSTGKPKGVMINHSNLYFFTDGISQSINLRNAKSILAVTTISFDISILEYLSPLTWGTHVLIANEEEQHDPLKLSRYIENNKIEVIQFTPSRLATFLTHDRNVECLKHVKSIIIGGERFPEQQLHRLQEKTNANIYNAYGPTEATIWVTVKDLTKSKEVTIGTPIKNTNIYIVNDNKLVKEGGYGEIVISGKTVGIGYKNLECITNDKFLKDIIGQNGKMYKTGDIGRYLPNGDIEISGRIDEQVKIQGYRIELGEIEAALLKHDSISEAAAVIKENKNGMDYLCAYYLCNKNLNSKRIRAFLKNELPQYMIPQSFVKLDKMILTPNGKTDKKALSNLELNIEHKYEYVTPRTDTEVILSNIWKELLNLSNVGINYNFFDFGGNSLIGTYLLARIQKEFNIECPMTYLFDHPTIKELSEFIESAATKQYKSIIKSKKLDVYPLTPSQRAIFFLSKLDNVGISYNWTTFARLIQGKLDIVKLEGSIRQLIEIYEPFRSTFNIVDDEPVQIIHDKFSFNIEYKKGNETSVVSIIDKFIQTFDLMSQPLLRACVIEIEKDKYIFVVDAHHIIFDPVTQEVFEEELACLYNGKVIKSPKLQFKDFAYWLSKEHKAHSFKDQGDYWNSVFEDSIPVLNFPNDYQRGSTMDFHGDHIVQKLDNDMNLRLYEFANDYHTSVYAVLFSVYFILLNKYTGQNDIVVGTPIMNRKQVESQRIPGFFLNSLPIRAMPEGNKTYETFLNEVQHTSLSAHRNQDYPFEEIVAHLGLTGELSVNPLFNTMFAIVHYNSSNINFNKLDYSVFQYNNRSSKFDILMDVVERDFHIQLELEYATSLFSKEKMDNFLTHYVQALDYVIQNPKCKIQDIKILMEKQVANILALNDIYSKPSLLNDRLIHTLIETTATTNPKNIAIQDSYDSISYETLNSNSNKIAHYLRNEHGVNRGEVIGIMIDRSIVMVEALLGIIKSGAGYVALDPTYPEERIGHMLLDCKATKVLTDSVNIKKLENFNKYEGDIIDVIKEREKIKNELCKNPKVINIPADSLYVGYTSGTTGMPNGSCNTHEAIINLFDWQTKIAKIDCSLNCLQFQTINYCASVQEILFTLISGGKIYLIGDEQRKDMHYFLNYLSHNRIENLYLPFYYLNYIFSEYENLPSLKFNLKNIITSGEQLIISPALKKYLKNNSDVVIHNHYGNTELHVVSAFKLSKKNMDHYSVAPIGKPILNTEVYILDDNQMLVPIGVFGEIYIYRPHGFMGYINNEVMNREKIVNVEINGEIKTVFKTGDYARWLFDGNIEYKGRFDKQVKVRGFRIELDEVEKKIHDIEGVKSCAVVVRQDNAGNDILLAYVVGDEAIRNINYREQLIDQLPMHMMPVCHVIDSMPLMPNGKIDRNNLPDIVSEPQFVNKKALDKNAIKMIMLWQDEFQNTNITLNDNFVLLGGNSIKAVMLKNKINEAFKSDISIQQFLTCQSVDELLQEVAHSLS